MLTFEQKQAIIDSFPELTKKEISLKRLNYHFMDSLYEKTIVVEKLHQMATVSSLLVIYCATKKKQAIKV